MLILWKLPTIPRLNSENADSMRLVVTSPRTYSRSIWAYAKINILHLHLSDNQGFRIQSTSHPEVNSATFPLYTRDQMNSLIQLAAQYHITIVPEIEFPAHAQAI